MRGRRSILAGSILNRWDDGICIMVTSKTVDQTGMKHPSAATRLYGKGNAENMVVQYNRDGIT